MDKVRHLCNYIRLRSQILVVYEKGQILLRPLRPLWEYICHFHLFNWSAGRKNVDN